MSVTAPRGFVANGIACGIKASGDRDLALVAVEPGTPVPAAGVFTANLAAAAPVTVSRAHLAATGGRAAARPGRRWAAGSSAAWPCTSASGRPAGPAWPSPC